MKFNISFSSVRVLAAATCVAATLSLTSCEEDQYTSRDDLFQPRFIGDEKERVINFNDYVLTWYEVNDAVSYTFQLFTDGYYQDLVMEKELTESFIRIEDLPYGSAFHVRVRCNAANADNNSQWATTKFSTEPRPDYAQILQGVSRTEIGDNEATIRWVVDPENPVDSFSVVATMNPDLPQIGGYLTDAQKAAGEIHLTDLAPITIYTVNIYDTTKPRVHDKPYNTVTFRTTGPAPKTIDVALTANLSDMLREGNQDLDTPEGTQYNLQSGSTYTISPFSIRKGFRLVGPTEGAKPVIVLNGTWSAAAGAYIAELAFENVEIRNQAINQYFFNASSSFSIDAVNFINCDFRSINRGFWRHQSSNAKRISEIVLDNCWFDQCGWQSGTYGTFNFGSAGKNEIGTYDQVDNITIRNCTFSRGGSKQDSAFGWGNLIAHSSTSLAIDITVENVTFYDFCVNSRLIDISNTERSTVTIRNVIVASPTGDLFANGSGTRTSFANNYVTADYPLNGSKIGATSLTEKAVDIFVNPEGGDYTIKDRSSILYLTQAGDLRWIK